MRLGGPTTRQFEDPGAWVEEVRRLGYGAAYCPVDASAASETVRAFERAAARAGIVIAEVGAWSNPLSRDAGERQKALDLCRRQLHLADEIGAVCCVNIAGSRGPKWDGPSPDNLTEETFALIVEMVRGILDEVKPRRAFFTLEPMPWAFPYSAESYLRLLRAIDRPQFAAHLDPVNMINSVPLFYDNSAFLRDLFRQLGPYCKSIHAKDITLGDTLTVHLAEARPGLGRLDYRTLLTEANRLPADTPFMVEHLPSPEEYAAATAYIRQAAREAGLAFVGPSNE